MPRPRSVSEVRSTTSHATWLAGFLILTAFPFAASVYLSFTRYDIVSTPVWVGVANYRELFGNDPLFWKSLWVTLKSIKHLCPSFHSIC